MTETDDDYLNRQRTANDEKLWTLELAESKLIAPDVGIFESPTRCYKINKQWAKIVMGAISAQLLSIASWQGATNEDFPAIRSIQEFLVGAICCTIEELLSDEEFFNDEYVPQTFGDLYQTTIEHNEDLNAMYDGTPQSIGTNIPTTAPNVVQKNALCYAIHSFVKLYCSSKLCIIQSKNFLEIQWTLLQQDINTVYNLAVQTMGFIYTPDVLSCFVSDTEAIDVLQDTAAIETLACWIYDQLDGLTINQTNWDETLLNAAINLAGNAGKIACIMQQDNNLTVYINFLEAYSIALNRVFHGEELECPCETPTTYWMLYKDFRTGNKCGTQPVVWNGSGNDGHWAGDGWAFNVANVTTLNVAFGFDMGDSFVVRAFGERAERQISDGNGTNDISVNFMFLGENYTGTSFQMNTNGVAISGANVEVGVLSPLNVTANRSIHHRARVQQHGLDGVARLKVHQMVYWGLPNALGEKPVGSVWAGNSLPATVAGLFP